MDKEFVKDTNDNNVVQNEEFKTTDKNKEYKEDTRQNKINQKKKKKKTLLKNIRILIIKTIFIIVMFYITFFIIFGVTRMSDLAMKPTIAAGDLILYYRLDKEYHVGDVVTFVKDGKRYVSRIIATPGQTVSLNMNNEFMTSDGNEQHQTYFQNIFPENSNITYPYRVDNDKVFVVGDYRIETNDSRSFGAIDVSSIDGKVISILQTKDI